MIPPITQISSSAPPTLSKKRVHFDCAVTEIGRDKSTKRKKNYLDILVRHFGDQSKPLIKKSLSEHFWAFKKEIKDQDQLIFKTFDLLFCHKTNLEQAKIIQDKLNSGDRQEELSKLIQEQEEWLKPFEEELQTINEKHAKGKETTDAMKKIYYALRNSQVIKLKSVEHLRLALLDLQSNHSFPPKDGFAIRVIAWLQQIIIDLIGTPQEKLIQNLKKRVETKKEILNSKYQNILQYYLLEDPESELSKKLNPSPIIKDELQKEFEGFSGLADPKEALIKDIPRMTREFPNEENAVSKTSLSKESYQEHVLNTIEDFTGRKRSAAESLAHCLSGQTGIADVLSVMLHEILDSGDKRFLLTVVNTLANPSTVVTTKNGEELCIKVSGSLGFYKIAKKSSQETIIGTYTIIHTMNIANPHNPKLSTSASIDLLPKNKQTISNR